MRRFHFLLLDDSLLDAQLIQDSLIDGGINCEFLRVNARSDFVTALKTQQFDLILAAYPCPAFEGATALAIALALSPQIPFIFVSATLDEQAEVEMLKRGATDYVLKQRLGRLVPSVNRALQHVQEHIERERAEQAQRQSEIALHNVLRRLDFHVENSPLAFIEYDQHFRVTRWSKKAEALFGWQAGEVLGKHPRDWQFVFEEDQEAVDVVLKHLCNGYKQLTATYNRNYTKDGSVLHCEWYSSALFDDSGKVISILSVVLDITERKQAEAAQRRSQALFDSFMLHIPGCAYIKDEQGRYVYANPSVAQVLQLSVDEVIGKTDVDLMPAAVAQQLRENDRQVLTSGQANEFVEFFHHHQDEEHHWMAFKFPLPDITGRQLLGGMSFDMTDRKQLEDALRTSEAKLSRLVDANIIGVIVANQHQVLEANDIFLQMLGYSREELIAGQILWPEMTPPEYLQQDLNALEEILAAGRCGPFEKEYLRKDGSRLPILLGGILLQESPLTTLCFVVDLSDRKRTEIALRQSEERLRLALQAARMVAWTWDARTRTVSYSETASEVLGFPSGVEKQALEPVLAVIHPDDLAQHQAIVQAAIATQGSYLSEFRIIRPDNNKTIWVEDRGNITFDLEGNLLSIEGILFDITDRKLAEFSLHEGSERLNLALVAAKMGDWRWNSETDTTTLSERTAEIFGIPFCRYIPRQKLRNCLHEGDRERARLSLDQAILEHSDYDIEYRVLHPNGTLRWVATKGRAQYDASGKVIDVLGVVQDITDRKQAEEALRQSEAKFQRLANNVPGAIGRYLMRPDGSHTIPYISPGCRDLFGLEPEAVQQDADTLWSLVHPADIASLRETLLSTAQLGQPLYWEGRYRMPSGPLSGQTKWIQIAARSEKQADNSILLDGLLIDVTHLKEATAERDFLLSRERRYSNQLHGLTKAVLRMSSILSIEEALQVITEQAHEIIGANQCLASMVIEGNWQDALHFVYFSDQDDQGQDNPERVNESGLYKYVCQNNQPLRLTQAELEAHQPSSTDPSCLVAANLRLTRAELEAHPHWRGSTDPTLPLHGWLAAPLIGRKGQNLGVIQLSDKEGGDFTEEDEAILVQLAQMAAAVIENAQLYKAEKLARSQAESANRIKDEFLAVLSHELRTPLNPILGWAKLLQVRKLDEATTTRALETIERNAKLQTQLIEDLLDVSRILRDKLSLRLVPVDLAATILTALETVRLSAEAKNIHIQTDLHRNVGVITGDTGRLQQVIWNLLSNAIKFTPENGRIDICLTRIKSFAQVTVRDTGKGINPDFLPHVFEYFRQADASTTRMFGGLGLGLAIVRHLVDLHGGQVYAESIGEGQGSTFTIQLPLLAADPDSVQVLDFPEQSIRIEGVHLLLVDDESDTQELLISVLKEYGALVTAVTSAHEALQVLESVVPDIVLSDIAMPEIDGYTLMRRIRALPLQSVRQIPAIALTAYAGESDMQQAFSAGFQRHLAKPIELNQLLQAISELV